MKLSTKGQYGLRALLDMAIYQNEGPVTLNNIAARQDISEGYLEQLMMPLKRAGIVKSVRGAQGGYLLAKRPEGSHGGRGYPCSGGPIAPVACVDEENPEECVRAELLCDTHSVGEGQGFHLRGAGFLFVGGPGSGVEKARRGGKYVLYLIYRERRY